eukprot:3449776-Alexandrium_andersonii.AAC.1
MPPQAAGQRRLEPVPEPSDAQGLRQAALLPLQPRAQGGVDHPPGHKGRLIRGRDLQEYRSPPRAESRRSPPRRAERIAE